MPSPTSEEFAARLNLASGTPASSQPAAAAVAATWRDIEHALTPIIGNAGVAALYHRSVHLTCQTHPWLADAKAGAPASMDLGVLTSMLLSQTAAEAAAGGARLLHTFCELLASLIGASLTDRLLRAVWARFLVGAPPDGLP